MIISHKYKFVFIGLPFSASSAISKELYLQYEGIPYLRKHSLHHEFEKVATKIEKDYFVFAVLRNPMEIVVTAYEKMKANSKGNFTNPDLFSENGGHITKKLREKFNFIHDNKASFQEYFLNFFMKPFDNFSSLTLDKCDFVIRYENIDEDYILALEKSGVSSPKPLPVANKTVGKKRDLSLYYTHEIKERTVKVFGPFLSKYNYPFLECWGEVKVSLSSKLQFMILGFLRKLNQKYFKKLPHTAEIKGTIYGDMQRGKLN
ncbi:sulfotransferase family protein [Flavobacteriales bacterium]|jgi:hypothetical protein|nr:sulfotransferase family protein [Flavobacteriales bacterium]